LNHTYHHIFLIISYVYVYCIVPDVPT